MANQKGITGSNSALTTVKGIKLLHKRYTTQEWANHKLYQGEFGIDITTGEVRGYVHYTSGSTVTEISWSEATPIGRTDISVEEGTPADRSYIYGITQVTDGGKVSYKLNKAQLPEITIGEDNTSDENLPEVSKVVTKITRDEKDPDKINYTYGWVPDAKFNDVNQGKGYISGITQVPGKYNEFNITRTALPTLDGTKVSYDKTTATVVGGIDFSGHTITATGKTIRAAENSKIGVTTDSATGDIVISIDDSNYAQADITGAMTFKGTIDISDSSKVNLTSGSNNYNWSQGFTYKIIQSQPNVKNNIVTSGDIKLHVNDEMVNSYAAKPGDLLVAVQESGITHICVIPSGDESDGTVTQILTGDGLTGGPITSTGTISHVTATKGSGKSVGTATPASGSQWDNANLNTESPADEEYTVINYVELDNKNLGHVTDVRKNKIKVLGETSIKKIVYSNGTQVESGDAITVTPTQATETSAAKYVVNHTKLYNEAKTFGPTDAKKAVGKVKVNEYGHVTGVEEVDMTDAFKDANTWRDVKINGNNFLDNSSTGNALDFVQSGHITISQANGKLQIGDSITNATAQKTGLVGVHSTTTTAITPETVASTAGNYYASTIDSEGKLSVFVDKHYVNKDENYSDSGLQFAAFKRDQYGHVVSISTIDALDGND